LTLRNVEKSDCFLLLASYSEVFQNALILSSEPVDVFCEHPQVPQPYLVEEQPLSILCYYQVPKSYELIHTEFKIFKRFFDNFYEDFFDFGCGDVITSGN
jgi:hypothetical protein